MTADEVNRPVFSGRALGSKIKRFCIAFGKLGASSPLSAFERGNDLFGRYRVNTIAHYHITE